MQGIITLRYKTTKLCIVQHFNVWNIIFINNISSLNLKKICSDDINEFSKNRSAISVGIESQSCKFDRRQIPYGAWTLEAARLCATRGSVA